MPTKPAKRQPAANDAVETVLTHYAKRFALWVLPLLLSGILGYALLFGDHRWMTRADARNYMTVEQLNSRYATKEDLKAEAHNITLGVDAKFSELEHKSQERADRADTKQDRILGGLNSQHDDLLVLKQMTNTLDGQNTRLVAVEAKTSENRERLIRLESQPKANLRRATIDP